MREILQIKARQEVNAAEVLKEAEHAANGDPASRWISEDVFASADELLEYRPLILVVILLEYYIRLLLLWSTDRHGGIANEQQRRQTNDQADGAHEEVVGAPTPLAYHQHGE